MKTYFKLMIIPFLVLFLLSGTSIAAPFGTNITISDQNYNTSGNSWYTNHEDQEVEPGMSDKQEWDLEGFFLNTSQYNSQLTMIGGFDFDGRTDYPSGDIFIDIDGDAIYGDYHKSSDGIEKGGNFGYDYVLDLDFTTNRLTDGNVYSTTTYSVYELNKDSVTLTAYYDDNYGSSPWRYESDGVLVNGWENKRMWYEEGISDQTLLDREGISLLGGEHNALMVDLGFLGHNIENFTAHFTMKCGNDNLMGSTAPVPEPATLLLFGTGLIGLAGVGRKKFKR